MYEILAGIAIGTVALPFYDRFVKPYVLFRYSGLSLLKSNREKVRILGKAVIEWLDSYRFQNLFSENSWDRRKALPEDVRNSLEEKLNTLNLHKTAKDVSDKMGAGVYDGSTWKDMHLQRVARKELVKSFYKEPAVLAYLTS